MNCKKAEGLLVGYMYGELSAKQVVDIERHLEVCDRCAATLESWRAIHQGFRKSAEEEPQAPGYFKQKLMIAAKEELTRKSSFAERFALLLKPALILPLIVFVLLTVLYLPWQPAKESNQARIPSEAPALRDERKQFAEPSKNDRLETSATNATAPKLKTYDAQKEASKDTATMDRLTVSDERRNKVMPAAPAASAPEAQAPLRKQEQSRGEIAGGLAAPQEMAAQKSYLQNQPASAAKKIAEQEESDNSYYNEAQSRFRQDDLKGGLEIAKRAIASDNAKTLAVQFHQTGIQYQQSRECGKAIPQFLLIINNYRDYPELQNVLIRLADCYEEIGQIDSARNVYMRLLSYPATRDAATQKIQQLDKKIQSQQELKALGYTNDKN